MIAGHRRVEAGHRARWPRATTTPLSPVNTPPPVSTSKAVQAVVPTFTSLPLNYGILHKGGGGDCGRRDWQKMRKMRENAENAAKNAIGNAVLLEWCLPLETPMFRLVLHNRALKP